MRTNFIMLADLEICKLGFFETSLILLIFSGKMSFVIFSKFFLISSKHEAHISKCLDAKIIKASYRVGAFYSWRGSCMKMKSLLEH